MAIRATPATGTYRPNPALGLGHLPGGASSSWSERAAASRFGATSRDGSASRRARARPTTCARPPRAGGSPAWAGATWCRGCTSGPGPMPPAPPELRHRGPGNAPRRAVPGLWRPGRGAGAGGVAVRRPRAGHRAWLVRLDRHARMTLAPFVAAGRGRPAASPACRGGRADGVRPVAGVALEWFMRLIRVEAGVGPPGRRVRAHGRRESGLVGAVVAALSSQRRPHRPIRRTSRPPEPNDAVHG